MKKFANSRSCNLYQNSFGSLICIISVIYQTIIIICITIYIVYTYIYRHSIVSWLWLIFDSYLIFFIMQAQFVLCCRSVIKGPRVAVDLAHNL